MQEFRWGGIADGRCSYRHRQGRFQAATGRRTRRAVVAGLALALAGLAIAPGWAADRPLRLVAFGDSLTAGLGVGPKDAFPAKLEAALRAKGLAVEIANAGVSGDTTTGGLARLDWSIPEGTDGVIVELGANDALRGVAPEVARRALDAILARLKERGIPVLLCGMRAPPNLGPDYAAAFESIFPDLAAKYGTLLYPFFLEGVASRRDLNQPDGLHPLPAGVDTIVAGILPVAEELVARARQAKR